MMKNVFNVSAITVCLFAVFTTTSCEKENVTIHTIEDQTIEVGQPENENDCVDFANLIGEWNWVASSGGIAGEHINAEDVDDEIQLEISASNIKRYENGELVYDSEYSIEVGMNLEGYESEIMTIDAETVSIAVSRQEDVLILSEQVADGYIHQYIFVE